MNDSNSDSHEDAPKRDLYPNELAPTSGNREADPTLPWLAALDLNEVDPGLAERLTSAPESETFAKEVLVGNRILAVIFEGGHWYAMDGICAHQGGPIAEGHVADGCVTCPWHGWQYELATGKQTINQQPLQSVFPIRQNGSVIEVQMTE
ncbi:Rieske (2Fe-2S) protein [Rhodopirellula sp. JC740]|uniref:Rieske (2Fe-2S) protein n=1 Tax=Rhodopirellula halodulae TaxID=2894198 RepID=A0ABS8NMX3_9BACT|nr:Rieske (2Fe-2S) protein [Rhodopirellula sp. JC740]MCC9644287.1 Rieske (2Fe-2S) protein [Rhodopirellula sp. JC740]